MYLGGAAPYFLIRFTLVVDSIKATRLLASIELGLEELRIRIRVIKYALSLRLGVIVFKSEDLAHVSQYKFLMIKVNSPANMRSCAILIFYKSD